MFLRTLGDVRFLDSVADFTAEISVPAFELDDAEEQYVSALGDFAARWGLDTQWFRSYCHDLAWATQHESPRRFYGHPVSNPIGRVVLRLRFDRSTELPLMAKGEPGEDLSAHAIWAGDSREELQQWVMDGFDAFWSREIAGTLRDAGAGDRRRPLQHALRDARAYLIRELVRERRGSGTLIQRTIAEMHRRWPDAGYEELTEASTQKALTNFGRLLRSELEA